AQAICLANTVSILGRRYWRINFSAIRIARHIWITLKRCWTNTSETLTKALPVIGDVSVTLRASSTAPSTAFTAKLVDLHPDGYAQIISDGIVVTPAAAPNTEGTYTIRLTSTGTVFKPGHKIRLEISSSSYPQHMVHTNTTDPIGTAKNLVVATQTVNWAGTSLNLPVAPVSIPANALDPAHPANSLQSAIAAAHAEAQP
ncbi:MAG: hypothetical protein RL268_2824, partial [Pseudomonadota bacterium]